MAGVRVKVTTNRIADVLSTVRAQPSKLVRDALGVGETVAKREVAVDTGALRSSIRKTVRQSSGELWTDQSYAAAQEFGTAKQSGKPFMRPAAAAAGDYLRGEGLKRAKSEIER
jgi:HK97 gp10 family phage protein